MDLSNVGKWIVIAGLVVVVVGGLVWLVGRVGLPLGRLPGDIHVQRDGFTFYFPLATSILVSILLTVVLNLIIRFLRR
jgi:hypothetical protein